MATVRDIIDSIMNLRTGTPEADLLGSITFSAITASSSKVVSVWEGTNNVAAAGLMQAATEESGSFTGTLTGCTTSPTGTVNWLRVGPMVFMSFPAIVATSNSTSCTVTGVTAALSPVTTQRFPILYQDNGVNGIGYITLSGGTTTLTLATAAGGAAGFTAAGSKGINLFTISYRLT